jgi:hypothetical protein
MRPPLRENQAYESTVPFEFTRVHIKCVNRPIYIYRVCVMDIMTLKIAHYDFHQETLTTLVSHT